MIEITLVILTIVGLALLLVMAASRLAILAGSARALPAAPRSVTILRPLKGLDAGLEENLESLFRLEYPSYQVVLGIQDRTDPALEVARRVAARHPAVPSSVAVAAVRLGLNPKVNNLAGMLPHARHELLLISDSNVRVDPPYLADMVGRLEPEVGLVCSPVAAVDAAGAGGVLEAMQLNGFVLGGVCAAHLVLRRPIVMGKSMLLRRTDLERMGGLPFLARYLAEDHVCGEEIVAMGMKVAISSRPVHNVLGRLSIRDFARRHLRWAVIRWRICPLGYLGELLLNPLPPALALFAVRPDTTTGVLAAATLALATLLAAHAERGLGIRRPLGVRLLGELVRSLAVAALWPVAIARPAVSWRGHPLRVGPRSLLDPPAESWAMMPGQGETPHEKLRA